MSTRAFFSKKQTLQAFQSVFSASLFPERQSSAHVSVPVRRRLTEKSSENNITEKPRTALVEVPTDEPHLGGLLPRLVQTVNQWVEQALNQKVSVRIMQETHNVVGDNAAVNVAARRFIDILPLIPDAWSCEDALQLVHKLNRMQHLMLSDVQGYRIEGLPAMAFLEKQFGVTTALKKLEPGLQEVLLQWIAGNQPDFQTLMGVTVKFKQPVVARVRQKLFRAGFEQRAQIGDTLCTGIIRLSQMLRLALIPQIEVVSLNPTLKRWSLSQ